MLEINVSELVIRLMVIFIMVNFSSRVSVMLR